MKSDVHKEEETKQWFCTVECGPFASEDEAYAARIQLFMQAVALLDEMKKQQSAASNS